MTSKSAGRQRLAMRTGLLTILLVTFVAYPQNHVTTAAGRLRVNNLAQYVDPFIGTGPSGAQNAVGGGRGGSVFPGATVPFGMVQLSPDTPNGEPSGYGYPDTSITG